MKSKRTLMALLVALLAFVAVMSVASGQKVEIQNTGRNVRIGTLKCGPSRKTRARASFQWTKQGKVVGINVNFKCKGGKSQRLRLVPPEGADDFHVSILVWKKGTAKQHYCKGVQSFSAGQVPVFFREDCFLTMNKYAIFRIKER